MNSIFNKKSPYLMKVTIVPDSLDQRPAIRKLALGIASLIMLAVMLSVSVAWIYPALPQANLFTSSFTEFMTRGLAVAAMVIITAIPAIPAVGYTYTGASELRILRRLSRT